MFFFCREKQPSLLLIGKCNGSACTPSIKVLRVYSMLLNKTFLFQFKAVVYETFQCRPFLIRFFLSAAEPHRGYQGDHQKEPGQIAESPRKRN